MKKDLRKKIIGLRMSQTNDEIIAKSVQITERVLTLNPFEKVNNVLLFVDFRKEVITKQLIEYVLDHNLTLVLPRIDMKLKKMTLHVVKSMDELTLSNYGILEPDSSAENVPYDSIDLILSPGVAFDKNGFRLGYGGGFYDRLLSQKRTEVPVIALAFDLQIVKAVPTEPHDISVDMIVTESTIIIPSKE